MSIHDKEREHAKEACEANRRPPIPHGFKEYRPPKAVLLGGPVPRPVVLFVFAEGDAAPYGVRAHPLSDGVRIDGRTWRRRAIATMSWRAP